MLGNPLLMTSGSISPPGSPGYATDSHTKLLLHFEGDFTDSAAGAVGTIVPSLSFDADSKISGSSSLKVLDNNAQYKLPLSLPSLSCLTSNYFTIEGWFNISPSCVGDSYGCITFFAISYSDSPLWVTLQNGAVRVYSSTLGLNYYPTFSISKGQWHHLALTRDGTQFKLYLDGYSGTNSGSGSGAIAIGNYFLSVGGQLPGRSAIGNIDEFRVSDIVRYTGDFTPTLPGA